MSERQSPLPPTGEPGQGRREFLLQAGLMAGAALVGLSPSEAEARPLPVDTKIDKLGYTPAEVKILTPRAKQLTKKELVRLHAIQKKHPKAPQTELLKHFNSYLKTAKQEPLTIKDLDSLKRAGKRLQKKAIPEDGAACCCCLACCCCASVVTEPLVN